MKLEISHTTRYQYDCEVQLLQHLLYLRPRENPLLKVTSSQISIQPDFDIYWMLDDFDNLSAGIHFSKNASLLEIKSECTVETTDIPPFDFLIRDYANHFPFAYEPLHQFNLAIYLSPPDTDTQDALTAWLKTHFQNRPTDTVSWVSALNQVVYTSLAYQRRDEPGIQSPLETISSKSGTCRDYASLFVACARTLGLAARFVSGYLYDPNLDPQSSGDMHAWAEVFLPGAGWRGIDPTHGLFCDNAYVPVAHAVVAESINPIQGSFYSAMPAEAKLTTDVRIRKSNA